MIPGEKKALTADSAIRESLLMMPVKTDRIRGVVLKNDTVVDRVGSAKQGGRSMGFQGEGEYNRGPKELHKAVCSDCKKECEVPFKPRGDRPIYCRECYSKRKDSGR